MMGRLLVAMALVGLAPSIATAVDTSVSGRLDLTGAEGLDSGSGYTGRQSLQARIKSTSKDIEANVLGRVRYLQLDGYPPHDAEVREATLALRRPNYSLTFGRQQVVWGKLDVVRFTDSVNPVDTADLFYEDLVEARIPLWMVNYEWFADSNSLQVLLIPDLKFNRLPSTRLADIRVNNGQPPARRPENWSYGMKFFFQPADWAVELSALRSWDFNPVANIDIDASGPFVQENFVRQTRLGFTAETRLGKTIFRMESLYVPREFFPPTATVPQAPSSPVWRVGSALEIELGNFLVSGQLLREQATKSLPIPSAETTRTYGSLLVQRKFLQDRLGVRLFAISGLDHYSQWLSLQTVYQVGGNHEFKLQLDRFGGEQGSFFGDFRERDRLALTYSYRL